MNLQNYTQFYFLFKISQFILFYLQLSTILMIDPAYEEERKKAINRIKSSLASFKTYKTLTPATNTTELSEQMIAMEIEIRERRRKEAVRRSILEKAKDKIPENDQNIGQNGGSNSQRTQKKKKIAKPKDKIYLHCLSLQDVVRIFKEYCLSQNFADITFLTPPMKQNLVLIRDQLQEKYPVHKNINEDFFIIHYLKNGLTHEMIEEDLFTPYDHRLLASIIFYWQRQSYRQKYFKPDDPETDKLWRKKYKINRQFSVPRQGGQITFTQSLNPQKLKFYNSIYTRQTVSFYRKFLEFQLKNQRGQIAKFRELFEELYLPTHEEVLTEREKEIIGKLKADLKIMNAADDILNKLRLNQKDRQEDKERRREERFHQKLEDKKRAIEQEQKIKKQKKNKKKQIDQKKQNPQNSEDKKLSENQKTDHTSKEESKEEEINGRKVRKIDVEMFCKQIPEPEKQVDKDPVPVQFRRQVDRRMNPYKGYCGYTCETRAKSEARFKKLLGKVIQEHVELGDLSSEQKESEKELSPITPLPDLQSFNDLESHKGDIFQESESEQA